MQLRTFLKSNLYYGCVAGGFLFFLLTVPSFNALTMKCLKHIPGESYAYSDCTMRGALDQFIVLALVGLGISLGLIYARSRTRGFKAFIVLGVLLTLTTIGAYYLYLPQAQTRVATSPVYLESLKDK